MEQRWDTDETAEGNSLAAESMAPNFEHAFVPTAGNAKPAGSASALAARPYNRYVQGRVQELLQDAQGQIAQRNWQAAETKLTRAIGICSENPLLYELRGDVALQMTDFRSATLNFHRAMLDTPSNGAVRKKLVQAHYLHAMCLYDLALFRQALDEFEVAIAVDPDCPLEYHGRRLSCLALLGRHKDCLTLVNSLLEMYGENSDLFTVRARLHRMFGQDDHCFYDLQAALEIDIEHPGAVTLLEGLQEKAVELHSQAVKLSLNGKCDEALLRVSNAIQANPSAATFHILRGVIHRQLGDFPAAVDDFHVAKGKVGFDKRDSDVHVDACRHLSLTYNELAVECFRKKYYNEAIVLLNKAVGEEKKEPGIYINRGDCFYRTDELHFANADYEQALLLDPSDWAVRGRLAVVNCQLAAKEYSREQYQKSLQLFNAAIAVQPSIGQAYGQRARVQYMLKNLPATTRDVLSALYLDEEEETALSLASRLFPNQTAQQVLQTEDGKYAAILVENSLSELRLSYMGDKATQAPASKPKPAHTSKMMEDLMKSLGNILGDVPELRALGNGAKDAAEGSGAMAASAAAHGGAPLQVSSGMPSDGAGRRSAVLAPSTRPTFKKEHVKQLVAVSAEDREESLRKHQHKYLWPTTKLTATLQGGLPIPERALLPLEVRLADRAFNKQLVESKKRVDQDVGAVFSKRPSLQATLPPVFGNPALFRT